MDSSVYCLPADLLGKGAERVATQFRDRAGGPGLPVTALAVAATEEARQAGVRLTLLDETIPAQAYATGHGFDPGHVAVRADMGVAPRAVAQAGVHLEEPVYLTDPADADAALAWYRTQLGPAAPFSVVLRPGPPAPQPLPTPCAGKPPPPRPTTAPSSTSTPTASTASKP